MADIERARQLRKDETWAEKLVWSWLRDRHFTGYKFRRQHPLGIYYLDFFCEEAQLNVELDGSQHGFPDQCNTTRSGKSFRNRAASRRCVFGMRICGATGKASVARSSMSCRFAHRIRCRNIRGRRNLGRERKVRLNDRPHPGPLLRGEGETFAAPLKIYATGFAGRLSES